jgi:hypothetical protein
MSEPTLEEKLAQLENILINTSRRLEVLSKLVLEGKELTYSNYLEHMMEFTSFIETLQTTKKIEKLSDRIKEAIKYNATKKEYQFALLADDIGILDQSIKAEIITKANYDEALKLPHTNRFEKKLGELLAKD